VDNSFKEKQFLRSNLQTIIKKFEKGTRTLLTPSVTNQLLFLGGYLHDIVTPYFVDEYKIGYFTLKNYKNETFIPRGVERTKLIKSWKPVSVSQMTGSMNIGKVEFGLDIYYIDEQKEVGVDKDNLSYIKPNIKDFVGADTAKIFGDLYD
jgi:hypothetical protein